MYYRNTIFEKRMINAYQFCFRKPVTKHAVHIRFVFILQAAQEIGGNSDQTATFPSYPEMKGYIFWILIVYKSEPRCINHETLSSRVEVKYLIDSSKRI